MSKESAAEQKKIIRVSYLENRNRMEAENRRAASEKIAEFLFDNKHFKAAQTVFVYASYKTEVETINIILNALAMGKQVAVPKVQGEEMFFYEINSVMDLFPGYQGILEPRCEGLETVLPAEGDVMLVPGAVFDLQGGRIGYGKGYYDRYRNGIESTCGNQPYCIGLAFDCQISPKKLPLEEHDKKIDCILTERRVIMPRVEKS
ncbi:MAG: 5-formyltetrahydrofolate cyclo-ligase [Lachnospiraceae bacterium]|nr:5-formyltetrahydrofolate cyclo-ligase [Lachnospiraceae bacterium]